MIFLTTIFENLVHIGLMAFLWRCNFFIGGEGQEDLWVLTQERKTFFLQRLFSCVTTRAQWVLNSRLLLDIFFIPYPIQFWKSLGIGYLLCQLSKHLKGQLWPRVSDVFVYLNHQSDLLLNSWESPKMYPPKLYSGPTIQSRSAARRAAQDLVVEIVPEQEVHCVV